MLTGCLITLRPADQTDLPLLMRWAESPEMYAGSESDHWPWRAGDLEKTITRKPDYDKSGWFLILPHGDASSAAGWIIYRSWYTHPSLHAFDIGYRVAPEHRGRGYASAAARLLVNQLFSRTRVHRVQAHTLPDNIASQRVLEHAGLTREAVLRGAGFGQGRYHDIIMYAMLRTEWSTPASYAERFGPL